MSDAVPIHKTQSLLNEITNVKDRIMRRAYEIFQENGGAFGRDFENWLQAERELVWQPAIELREKDNELILEAAVSGIDPKDLEIEVTPEDIVLKADIRHEHIQNKETIHMCEFARGRTFRSIHLPKRINPEKVKAVLKNGLLRVTAEIAEESRAKKMKPEAA